LLAYVPNALFRDNIDDDDAPQLKQLTDPNYQHRYYVDGPPTAMDAYLKGQWRTVLIDALGAGGRALFALDVTDPGNFREDNAYQLVLWEIDEHTPGYGELGHILKSLPLVRQPDGKWVVIAGNGYHSAHGKAVLYIIDAEDGSPLQTIEVDAGPLNGLSAPQVADVDDDFIADYIYAGDLKGNLWKFIWDRDQNQWKVAYQEGNTPLPLFKATDGKGHAQPITAVPQVSIIPGKGGRLILFGTGKYFDEEDNTVDIPTQTFYGIWDNDWPPEERPTRDDLQVQTIDRDLSSSNKRVTTANEVDWAAFNADTGKWEGQKGWLFDLEQGERVVEDALILKERIIFTTLIPGNASDPCKPQA
ncbi:MAG: pilus assembly protein PilC, partial [Gammaproteobacteria bacterium]